MTDRPWISAYIDETGDRGDTGPASPIFGLASLVLNRTAELAMTVAVSEIRKSFKIPDDVTMSWKQHIKSDHQRAKHAAAMLAQVPEAVVVYAVCFKRDLSTNAYFAHDRQRFYDLMAYETLRLSVFAAAYAVPGGGRLRVRFGHVKNLDPEPSRQYFRAKAQEPSASKIPFNIIEDMQWVAAAARPCSQAADLYAGFLKAATWPDQFGRTEGSYLSTIWPQIRQRNGCTLPLGIYTPTVDSLRREPWWFCQCPECKKRQAH